MTSTVTTRPLHGSGQRTGLTSFPVTLVSGWGRKQSAHQTGCSFTVCTPLQDLCLFLLSLLMFLHKHTELDQSIPPMSCCLYDGVTRLPAEEKKLAVSYAKVNHCPVICNVCVCVCLSELFLTTSPDKWGRVESGREENFKKKNWIRRMQDCGNTCLILV